MVRVAVIAFVIAGLAAPAAGAQPIYRVRSGDTLSGIASRFRTTVAGLSVSTICLRAGPCSPARR